MISQSFGTAEEAFGSPQSLLNLRDAFKAAAANGVTVLASSGDDGTANPKRSRSQARRTADLPVPDRRLAGVRPARHRRRRHLPLHRRDATRRIRVDNTARRRTARTQAKHEIGWIDSGGGFSHVFSRPDYQSTLPAGSTPIGARAAFPTSRLQASPRTGALVYLTLPPDGHSGLICGRRPVQHRLVRHRRHVARAPQWAGLVAIADQINGSGLGLINPALYRIGADPSRVRGGLLRRHTGNNTDPDRRRAIPPRPAGIR